VLTLTTAAIAAIRALTTQRGLPEETGLRIVHQDTAGSIELSISPGPEAEDEVVESDGVRVFLQTEAAAMLEGKALDAYINEDGVFFEIAMQPV
jgi:Fe-S cluster assembly iron-binding protein IscA